MRFANPEGIIHLCRRGWSVGSRSWFYKSQYHVYVKLHERCLGIPAEAGSDEHSLELEVQPPVQGLPALRIIIGAK